MQELLANRIDSFEKLELVLALHGAPRSCLSIDELSQRLALPRDEIRGAVADLRDASLVELTRDDVQLLPVTSRDGAAVADLARIYKEDRFTLVKAMGEISVSRLRKLAARAFADAFVIGGKRRKDDDG